MLRSQENTRTCRGLENKSRFYFKEEIICVKGRGSDSQKSGHFVWQDESYTRFFFLGGSIGV
jgi:hypothetical protein